MYGGARRVSDGTFPQFNKIVVKIILVRDEYVVKRSRCIDFTHISHQSPGFQSIVDL